ncbi:DNA polymerase III subunits gamma/tau [Candidatus Termititenax persephonae]|uniref:DNA polymerase III subunit gamma/tau n=1 Tax=Candidatus Termititenax persephonae TaxID=2218525 RepID=A0A388TGE3_9BACT|nr:DNA polymerase III subunits gamma/tau [Candidatus Termititenax persephonae]
MAYLSLYRKYRSQDFETIVGQKHIVQTIKNALQSDRLAHAYIFSGPRGTGKTSLARILAKALNCAEGPTTKPCLKCPQCLKIKNGTAVDVIEIDAASNRGIDEMRQLREQVNFMPVEGRYKIYIIDEVHMLTTEAFNALLKTLEEPPAQTLFVLATTEIQKIPATIRSRCQRLDFKRITAPEIAAHLQEVCRQENVTIDAQTANYIARQADGGMRDALSLLDQLLSFKAGSAFVLDDILALLGTTVNAALVSLLGKILRRELEAALELTGRLVADGKDLRQVCKDILDNLRNLLLLILKAEQALDLSAEDIAALRQIADGVSAAEVRRLLLTFARAEADMRWNPHTRLVFELAVMELCSAAVPSAPGAGETRATGRAEGSRDSGAASVRPVPSAVSAGSAVAAGRAEPPKTGEAAAKMTVGQAATSPPQIDCGQSPGLAEIKQSWPIFLNKLKLSRPALVILLCEGSLKSYVNGVLTLRFKESYGLHKKKLLESNSKTEIERLLRETYGAEIKLAVALEAFNAAPEPEIGLTTEQILETLPGTVIPA